jgi:hypothetical protein
MAEKLRTGAKIRRLGRVRRVRSRALRLDALGATGVASRRRSKSYVNQIVIICYAPPVSRRSDKPVEAVHTKTFKPMILRNN